MHYWIELKTDMYEGLLFYFKIMEYIIFSSPKAQGLLRKREQNYCKARGNENTETAFAEPDRAFPHMNSQWLGLHAQNVHKINSAKVPTCWREGLVYPQLRSFWLLMIAGGGRVSILQGYNPKRPPILFQMV